MEQFFLLLGKVFFVGALIALVAPFILSFLQAKEDEAAARLIETPVGFFVSIDPKDKAYNFISEVIERASTKEDLYQIEQLLQNFKKRFGKCEMYCSLYGDYYMALLIYADSKTC